MCRCVPARSYDCDYDAYSGASRLVNSIQEEVYDEMNAGGGTYVTFIFRNRMYKEFNATL